MENKIVKIVLEDGKTIEFKERSIDHFRKTGQSENWVKYQFSNQHKHWEEDILAYFQLDIEDYAKEEYNLIDADEKRDISDFDDDDILEAAECRGILPESAELQNENIMNEDFVSRFVTIIDRGDVAEIENTLSYLEFKYKIS